MLAPGKALVVIVCFAFVANVLAATQDVATEALAIDLLTPGERGVGNGMQIAGYRVPTKSATGPSACGTHRSGLRCRRQAARACQRRSAPAG